MKRKPTSPGEILDKEFIEPLGLTQSQLAKHIDVDVKTINRLINDDKYRLSASLAAKLARSFSTSTAFWLNLQTKVDAYYADIQLQEDKTKIGPIAV